MHGPADALMTGREDLVLWLTVADCLPVVLTAGRWRSLGHCGWRGIAAGLAEVMVRELEAVSGGEPAAFRAWIGPGIGPCCYEVGADVAAALPEAMEADGTRANLRVALVSRLERAGVPAASVGVSDACTACHPGRFFSHRRDGVPSGRMAAVSWFASE
jgi:YfiH family protein